MKESMIQIRWHGRGGQGAITAAKIVAKAAFASGYPGVVMTPTFGTERRGAPVMTSLKLSKNKIHDLSPIVEPDIVIILDKLLIKEVDVTAGLKSGGLIVINTPLGPEKYLYKDMIVATANVNEIAEFVGLPSSIVNTGIIGAFARASNIITLEELTSTIASEFEGRSPDKNVEVARVTYDKTLIGGI